MGNLKDSQDVVQGAKVPPPKNRKVLGFDLLLLGESVLFILFFTRGEGEGMTPMAPWLRT